MRRNSNGNAIWSNSERDYDYYGVTAVEGGVIAVSNEGQIVKFDLNGNIVWEKTHHSFKIEGMTKVEDGTVTVSYYGGVAKYDFDGNVVWKNTEKLYNYNGVTTVEGGVIAVGYYGKVVKYDFDGNIVWENKEKTYQYYGVTAVEGGVIAVAGDGQVVKYDLNGNIIWENTEKSYTYNVVTTVEGGVIAAGNAGKVVKYNLNGNIVWENTENNFYYKDIVTVEDGVVAIGYGEIAKYDFDGNIVWQNTKKRYITGYDYQAAIKVNNGIIIVSSAGLIIKYDSNGNIVWENKEKTYSYRGVLATDDGLIVCSNNNGLAIYKNVILEPEIPASQSVTIKNSKKKVKITTEVEGTGGTISGQNDNPYEEVKYGKDSVKEIKAVPSTGYSVVSITINDKEIPFTENADGTVTLDKFIEMTEDKHIVVSFSNTNAKIEVNHYLWTEDDGTTTTKVAKSGTQNGEIDEVYATKPRLDIDYKIVTNKDYYGNKTENQIITDINSKYGTTYSSITELGYENLNEFKSDYYIPQNSTGTFKSTKQVVDYYYKEHTYTLTVKHLLEGTEENVPSKTGGTVADEVTEGYDLDDRYRTSDSEEVDYNKYELVEVPSNAEGTIEGDTEVRYYYRQKEHKITTDVKEHEETSSLGVTTTVKGGTITGEDLSPYEIVKHGEDSVKEIKAVPDEYYEVKKITVNGDEIEFTKSADGSVTLSKFVNMTEDKKVVVEFRKIQGKVIVHHYVEGTTNKIDLKNGNKAQDETKTGNIGDIYASKPHENAAIKYTIVDETPEKANGTFINGTIEVTYYYREQQVSVRVDKVWNDSNNRLGIRPSSVKVNLKAIVMNGTTEEDITSTAIPSSIQKQVTISGSGWTHTWNNLSQYSSDSKEIIYTVEEVPLTGNLGVVYSAEVTRDNTDPYRLTVTNTYTRPTEKINYVVNKIWDDNSNANGKRPEELVFNIKKPGSTTPVATYTINTLSETSHTFELDKYDERGNEINYTAEEVEKSEGDLFFYTTSGGNRQEISLNGKDAYKSEFTNKFEVPDVKVNVKVTKIWNDANNENEKRPASIKLVLYKVETTGTGVGATSTIRRVTEHILNTPASSNTFTYTFENQPKYDEHGNEIKYTVDEEEVNTDDLKFYSKAISETTNNEYEITNRFTVPEEKIEIEAEKIWVEENDTQKQRRPSSVVLKLMNGTTQVRETVVVNAENSWKTTFDNLAKFDERGNEIQYKLSEEETVTDDLKFYEKTGSSDLTKVDDTHYTLTFTNTFKVPDDKIELKATKVWEDENGKDRLDTIKLKLTGNGQTYEKNLTSSNVDETNSNNWIYIFTNLPKYNSDGEEIEYSLTEEEVNNGDFDGYITGIDGFAATNKLIIKETKIEKTGTEEITGLDGVVNYTINYEATIENEYDENCKITITDTLPYEIDTNKEYELNGGTYNSENKTITWEETKTPSNGKITVSKEISLVYKDLPINIDEFTNKVKGEIELANGVKEEKQDTFTTIVNFKRDVIVTKVWKGDTESGVRPQNVEIELLKNGTKIDSKKVKATNNWKVTFEDLEKYDEETREEITYTIEENNVPIGYYKEISTEDVTNTGINNLGFRVINNKYGKITITKEDKLDSSKKLGGAEFTLTKLKEENGKWVEDTSFEKRIEITSTEEEKLGIAEFKDLVYGKYRLQETKAPQGYELLRNTVDIEIGEANPDIQTSIQNKESTELPATGTNAKIAIVLFGITILLIAVKIKKKH